MKMFKQDIEKMAKDIEKFLRANEIADNVTMFYNDMRVRLTPDGNNSVEHNVSPLDYFEYVNPRHILSMSFEGGLYDALNYGTPGTSWRLQEKFTDLLNKYGFYYELGNAWNLTLFPNDSSMYDEIEYTSYEPIKEPKNINIHSDDVLPELKNIMVAWFELSETVGEGGSCTIGDGFRFTYKETDYFMSSCSPYQGSLAHEKWIKVIKQMLENIGATNVYYDYGCMD